MLREMRRKRQQLSREESIAVLERGTAGVLAVAGTEGYPYAVPLSYVYADGKLYFHSARTGHKLDAIRQDDRVSFCVIDQDQVMPEEYTTYFRSVIAFGRARILVEEAERLAAIRLLAQRYYPEDGEESRKAAIDKEIRAVEMIELKIEHLSGKEAIELIRQRSDGQLN